jgi:hypothetical protein
MRYEFYGQGLFVLLDKLFFNKGILGFKMTTNEIFRNMDRLFENFLIIKCKLCICQKYFDKYFPICQRFNTTNGYDPNLAL